MTVTFNKSHETYITGGSTMVTAIREDLSDLIYNISPTETPFMMMAGRGSCQSTKHEWQMDKLDAAADNAKDEGLLVDNTELETPVQSVRVFNYTQISSKSISVTGTMEVVNKAGRNSELSYQLAKRSKEIKRDIEFQCVGNTAALGASVAGTADGAASRRAGSVQASFHADWYQSGPGLDGTHISRGAGAGADGGWDAATGIWDAHVLGTARPLLESDLKGVIQGAWTNGGDPTVIMVGGFNKTQISTFTGNSTRFDRGEDKRLVAAIDVYESDFGTHRVIPNRFQRADDCFCFTPELNTICYLRPFRQHALAKTGDSEERQLLAEWTIKHSNNAGNAIVADLTTS